MIVDRCVMIADIPLPMMTPIIAHRAKTISVMTVRRTALCAKKPLVMAVWIIVLFVKTVFAPLA